MNWWTKASNTQRPQPHVIIELPTLARVHSKDRMAELYRAGNSLREIERQLCIPKTTARMALIEVGVEMRTSINHQSSCGSSHTGMRSGTIPYGYTYLEGKLVVEPREYKNVLEILRLQKSGSSFRAIARTLNNRKITTRLGKRWTHEIIKRICEREQQGGKHDSK